MRRIAVLCSGGDGPGMNAAIRSVVRCAIYRKLEVFGVTRGYDGLIKGDLEEMFATSVSNILTRGGTMLKTARSKDFMTLEGRKKAAQVLKKHKIDGLVVIGGNGSFRGAHIFKEDWPGRIIGIPGTIDNDICGSDYTIGADTAVATALDAIDKIRDTCTSMERIYVVEVMGRHQPFIAVRVGLSGGAEDVLVPDTEYDIERMCDDIKAGRKRGKISWIIIVSEGVASAKEVADLITEKTGFETRATVLGHVQRGGSPSALDRMLASRMGAAAVEALLKGETDKMVGIEADEVRLVGLKEACEHSPKKVKLNRELYNITKILAT